MTPGTPSKRSARTSARFASNWNEDCAIVFDPAQQRFLKDSIMRIQSEANRGNYTTIALPRISNSVECYVEAKGPDDAHREKVSMGTVDLGKLPWQLNAKRRAGKIKELYVLGKFQAPQ